MVITKGLVIGTSWWWCGDLLLAGGGGGGFLGVGLGGGGEGLTVRLDC